MRAVYVVALLAAACHALSVDRKPFVTREKVEALNARPGTTWKASLENGRVKGATLRQLKGMLGSLRVGVPKGRPMRKFSKEELSVALPDEFDSATNWPSCKTIPYIWDQSDCGSCWAVGGAGAMSDRYCTTGSEKELFVSARDLLSCCTSCGFGCNGGYPDAAWDYWVSHGLVTEACQPYPFPHCDHHTTGKYPPCGSDEYDTPDCVANRCADKNTTADASYHKGSSSYAVVGEEDYKRELVTNGPFEVAFTVYDDFPAYKSGVYHHTSDNSLGGHAVRIVGYGTLDGAKYWKIANSWNEDWGMDGYFLIKRGGDECGIESSGAAGKA